jgi:HAD superfamily hydrolase (TIGR01509 family)
VLQLKTMKIKAALIDLDDTLTDTKKLYKEALPLCHKLFTEYTKLQMSYIEFEERYITARDETHALVPTAAAKHNRAIYFQKLVENLDSQTDFELIYMLYHTYYDHVYNHMEVFPEALNLLKWLKENDKKIILVSNGNAHVRLEKIHALKIDNYIDYMVSSEEVGASKPSSQPFLVSLNKAHIHPEESVMIGNSASADIYGANRLGITTIQTYITDIPTNKPLKPEHMPKYAVRHLREVIDIIKYLDGQDI